MGTTSTIEFDTSPNTNVVTTAETVAQVTPPVSNRGPSDQIAISGTMEFTTGASTTSIQVKCRRGNGVAGTQVGPTLNLPAGAAVPIEVGFDFLDSPGEVAGQIYSITVTQVAATGNGTVNHVTGNVQVP